MEDNTSTLSSSSDPLRPPPVPTRPTISDVNNNNSTLNTSYNNSNSINNTNYNVNYAATAPTPPPADQAILKKASLPPPLRKSVNPPKKPGLLGNIVSSVQGYFLVGV